MSDVRVTKTTESKLYKHKVETEDEEEFGCRVDIKLNEKIRWKI